jgi:hypothetical protein
MTVGALAEQRNKVVRGPAFTAVAARGQRAASVRLYIGGKFAGVSVEPDATWSSMWRVRMGDRLSDMVNLTRAKDAAVSWALRAGFRPDVLGIKWSYGEAAPERSPVRSTAATPTSLRPDRLKPLSEAEAA